MLTNIGLFVFQAVLVFLSSVFLLRFYFLLIKLNISHYAPDLSRFVYALTDWAVLPLRRLIPRTSNLDIPSFLPAFSFQFILVLVKSLLITGHFDMLGHLIQASMALLDLFVSGLIGILIIGVVISWLQPLSTAHQILDKLAAPVLVPIRRIVPLIGGIDISPMLALLVLQIVQMMLASLRT